MMKQQDEGDQQAGDAPGVGELQRRRHHQLLVDHVGCGRQEDLGDEDCHHQSAERGEEALGPRRQAGDHRRHAHVLAAAEGDDGAEHHQPEEQQPGDLVAPEQRAVQHVAPDDAGKQDADLGEDENRGRNLGDNPQCGVQRRELRGCAALEAACRALSKRAGVLLQRAP